MSAGFRTAVLLGAFVFSVAFSYGMAKLGEPQSVWLWQLAGAL